MTPTPTMLDLVQASIRDVNDMRPLDDQLDPAPDAALAARLDSLGLVNLLVAAEAQVAQRLGRDVSLMGVLEASPADGMLRTVADFAEYVARCVHPGTS